MPGRNDLGVASPRFGILARRWDFIDELRGDHLFDQLMPTAGAEWTEVLECRFKKRSCPALTNESRCGKDVGDVNDEVNYCACGFQGPLCSECSTGGDGGKYFMSWSGHGCQSCAEGTSHAPTIALCVVMVLPVIFISQVLYLQKSDIEASYFVKFILQFRDHAAVKLRILFFMAQTVSQFSVISSSNGDAGAYPEPAASFAAALGVSNLDVLGFVPVNCIWPHTTFYHKLFVKTVGPLVPLVLLWMLPFSKAIRGITGEAYDKAWQLAAQLSLLWIELVLTSVSTTIVQTLVCDDFDDGRYLRAQLVLPCRGANRDFWVGYSIAMVLLYPVGAPALLLRVLSQNRQAIHNLLHFVTQYDVNQKNAKPTKLARLSRQASIAHILNDPSIGETSRRLEFLHRNVERYQPNAWYAHVFIMVLQLMQVQGLTSSIRCCEPFLIHVCVLRADKPDGNHHQAARSSRRR